MPFVLRKEGGGFQKGVPLKIVYPMVDIAKERGGGCAFEAGEPLLVLTRPGEDPDVALPVINFEGFRGEVYKGLVYYNVDPEPWGVLVNAEVSCVEVLGCCCCVVVRNRAWHWIPWRYRSIH